MKTKLDGIVTKENMDIIASMISVLEIPQALKINLVESVANVVYLYPKFFNKLTEKEKVEAMGTMALFFNTLLDKEINPLAAKLFTRAINAFNNNILDVRGECNG
jgi:hypothetical protein